MACQITGEVKQLTVPFILSCMCNFRGGRKTEKKDVSPQLTTRRQTRAASRRKK